MSKNWYQIIERTRTSSTSYEIRGKIKIVIHIAYILFWSKNNGHHELENITIEPYPYWEDEDRKEYKRLKKKYEDK